MRGRRRVARTPQQAEERQREQYRRYTRAKYAACERLRALHEDEYETIFNEELDRIYAEKGDLPWETTPIQERTGDSQPTS